MFDDKKKIFSKKFCLNFFKTTIFSKLKTFRRKGKDPDPEHWVHSTNTNLYCTFCTRVGCLKSIRQHCARVPPFCLDQSSVRFSNIILKEDTGKLRYITDPEWHHYSIIQEGTKGIRIYESG
jgi:hypothetical protein